MNGNGLTTLILEFLAWWKMLTTYLDCILYYINYFACRLWFNFSEYLVQLLCTTDLPYPCTRPVFLSTHHRTLHCSETLARDECLISYSSHGRDYVGCSSISSASSTEIHSYDVVCLFLTKSSGCLYKQIFHHHWEGNSVLYKLD